MDFITKLLAIQERGYIYVVVDWLTKFAHFFAIPDRYSASHVVELSLGRCSGCTGSLRPSLVIGIAGILGGFGRSFLD